VFLVLVWWFVAVNPIFYGLKLERSFRNRSASRQVHFWKTNSRFSWQGYPPMTTHLLTEILKRSSP